MSQTILASLQVKERPNQRNLARAPGTAARTAGSERAPSPAGLRHLTFLALRPPRLLLAGGSWRTSAALEGASVIGINDILFLNTEKSRLPL